MNPISIYPSTKEALMTFRKMVQQPNEDKPIVEMNDSTARDMKVIWSSIESLAERWRGAKDVGIPDMPTNRQEFWGAFASGHEPSLLPVVEEFIESSTCKGKTAIDLGCGNSPATKLLLKRGWRVIAVDNSKSALNVLISQNSEQVKTGQLTVIEEDVATFTPKEPVDLVIAADVFPYINPASFRSTWIKIHQTFVKDNGFLVGSLFRFPPNPDQLQEANIFKEMGAWLLPDRRMVRPLLQETGYEIKTCKYRIDTPNRDPICIQFIAEKKPLS